MKALWAGWLLVFVATLALGGLNGCGRSSKAPPPPNGGKEAIVFGPKDGEEQVHAGRVKLSATEKKAVEAQEFCPITNKRLGTMGTPDKLEVAGDFVFLCCAGCREAAQASPRDTKAKVEELRLIQGQLSKLEPEDKKLAAAQVFCVVIDESKLGSMGVPIRVMVEDQPVFVCCKGCIRRAQMNPKQTLAKREELLRKKN